MNMKRVLFILIAVFSLAIVFAGCDNLVGSDGNDNGDEENDNTGNPGVTAPGVAEFSITGDVEDNVEDGVAFFRMLDDDRFELLIAESFPFGSSIRIELTYQADDSDFFPEEREYAVTQSGSSDNWMVVLWELVAESIGAKPGSDSTLTIDSASSDLIEGSFRLHLIYFDDETEYVADGSFSAVPAPY